MSDVDIGTDQAIGALDLCVWNPINLAQMEECIPLLDDVDDPSIRHTAQNRSMGGQGGKVNYLTRQKAVGFQTVSQADLGAGFGIP